MSQVVGRPVGDRALLVELLRPLFVGDVHMDRDAFHRHLAANPRLIMAGIHGGVATWIPLSLALLEATIAFDRARPMVATAHPILWRMPGVRRVVGALSGADEPPSIADLESALSTCSTLDYYAFPESENCLYGDLREVKPFRFHGFIELCIRTQTPMLLMAHRGSEDWYLGLDLSGRLLPLIQRIPPEAFATAEMNKRAFLEAIDTYRTVNLPLPRRRARLNISFEPHQPEQYTTGLSEDWKARRRQVAAEGERIRRRMQEMYDALPA